MSLAPPSEYAEDAARIEEDYLGDATSEAEIKSTLDDLGFPDESQSAIQEWVTSTEEAWSVVDSSTQDAGSVERALQSETGGAIGSERAEAMSEEIASEINSARAEAAQRVDDNGVARSENGQFIGSLQNVEESVESDGIYFENTNTGTKARAASFDRGGR